MPFIVMAGPATAAEPAAPLGGVTRGPWLMGCSEPLAHAANKIDCAARQSDANTGALRMTDLTTLTSHIALSRLLLAPGAQPSALCGKLLAAWAKKPRPAGTTFPEGSWLRPSV